MLAFPDGARIEVDAELAGRLLAAARRLPPRENEEYYDPALQEVTGSAIREASAEAFDTLIAEITELLARPPHAAIVVGLRFDDRNRLLVGLNRAFGLLVAPPLRKPRAQLIHYIQPRTDLLTSKRVQSEVLHTDCADWPVPVGLVSMQCVRPDPAGGGRSRLIDLPNLRAELRQKLGDDVVRTLHTEAVPWQLSKELGARIEWRPILTDNCVCWRRYTIDAAIESGGIRLADELLEILEGVDRVLTETDRAFNFALQEGDFLIFDNNKTLHGRTALHGSSDESPRLMLRAWIRPEPPPVG